MTLNWSLPGHEAIKEFLTTTMANDKLAHGLLLMGPTNIGKLVLAQDLALALLCQANNKPCRQCQTCKQVMAGTYADYVKIEIPIDKKNISIEQIRDLQTLVNRKSFFQGKKVVIINQADTMSIGASNSLLKTLEEPALGTHLILVSSQPDLMLPTIKSRCQVLPLKALPRDQVNQFLLEQGVEKQLSTDITAITAGKIILAQTYANDTEQLEQYKAKIQTLLKLFESDLAMSFSWAEDLHKETQLAQTDIENLIVLVRDLMLARTNNNDFVLNNFIDTSSYNNYSLTKFQQLLDYLLKVQTYFNNNVSPRLILENVALECCS